MLEKRVVCIRGKKQKQKQNPGRYQRAEVLLQLAQEIESEAKMPKHLCHRQDEPLDDLDKIFLETISLFNLTTLF